MSSELLTAKEAAAHLKISVGAFYAFRRRHAIPSRGRGRALRFRLGDLEKAVPPTASGSLTIEDFSRMGREAARKMEKGGES